MNIEIKIDLQDMQWEFDYVDHDRNIARAIVYDESGQFYFVRVHRDDDFGKANRDLTDRLKIVETYIRKDKMH